MIRVLVVDDHPVVREGIAAVLDAEPDLEIVATTGLAEQAIDVARRLRPDVVLLDLELPGMDGIAAIHELATASPETRVIVFTAYLTDDHVLGAVRGGARGYLLKGARGDEIAQAIRVVHAGGSYLEPRVATRVLAEVSEPTTVTGGLTEREIEVLRLVAAGQSNKQIARTLRIAERTAKFHLTQIFGKLGANNRAQAVALAVERGML